MKKSFWKISLSLVALLTLTGCKHDIDVIAPDSIDSKYNIKFYSQSPHRNDTQGFYSGDQFIRVSSSEVPPYKFLVYIKNKKGQEVLDYIKAKTESPILKMELIQEEGNQKLYILECTKYFETNNLYVSDFYKTDDGQTNGYVMAFVPQIYVKMKNGYSIDIIEETYGKYLTMNDDEEQMANTYLFDCSVNSSYNVLKLAEEINNRDEVEWAEPNKWNKLSH